MLTHISYGTAPITSGRIRLKPFRRMVLAGPRRNRRLPRSCPFGRSARLRRACSGTLSTGRVGRCVPEQSVATWGSGYRSISPTGTAQQAHPVLTAVRPPPGNRKDHRDRNKKALWGRLQRAQARQSGSTGNGPSPQAQRIWSGHAMDTPIPPFRRGPLLRERGRALLAGDLWRLGAKTTDNWRDYIKGTVGFVSAWRRRQGRPAQED